MDSKNLNTEKKVFEAAKKVFLIKGLQAARMQEIADEAGINKSLLHYYYRSKKKLFEAVFEDFIYTLFKSITSALESDGDIFDRISLFINRYIGFLEANPLLPQFMMHLIIQNPDMLIKAMKKFRINPRKLVLEQFQKEIDSGMIKNIKPEQLIINIISLILFPFAAKPVIMRMLKIQSNKEFNALMEERKKALPEFIIKALRE